MPGLRQGLRACGVERGDALLFEEWSLVAGPPEATVAVYERAWRRRFLTVRQSRGWIAKPRYFWRLPRFPNAAADFLASGDERNRTSDLARMKRPL